MKKIKYIGHYAIPSKHCNRYVALSAVNKMSYICDAINESGYPIEILSASTSKKSARGENCQIAENRKLKLFPSAGRKNLFHRIINRIVSKVSFFCYLLFSLKKKDTVIVYHSLGFMKTINFFKRLKGFNLILEVEEIYGDVLNEPKTVAKELKFFKKADAYIFPTKMLDEKINTEGKPSVIIHGTYQVEEEKERLFNDGKIHVVYAGTLDPRKGGALAATMSGAYLPENYHVHILGFGSEEEKRNIQNLVNEVQARTKCTVTYDGVKSGEEYIQFLQSCDIGLSTQNPDAAFNETSFPSKILSYMANGLRVVSIRIPAIETSAIGEYMYYYDKQTPEEIAKAIIQINDDDYQGKQIISELNVKFISDIVFLLENVKK